MVLGNRDWNGEQFRGAESVIYHCWFEIGKRAGRARARAVYGEENLHESGKGSNRCSPAGMLAALAQEKSHSAPCFHFLSPERDGLSL